MPTIFKGRERNVLPRWRDFRATVALGELEHSAIKSTVVSAPADLTVLHGDWLENRTLSFAGDLLSAAAFARDKSLAREAAEFVLSQPVAHDTEKPIVRLAMSALAPVSDALAIDVPLVPSSAAGDNIRAKRRQLSSFPQNGIGWVDLSLLFASRGLGEKAKRAMLVGLSLVPNDRFVLRSAARLFLHLGELDRAHELLKNSPMAKVDPWVSAAEIAIATALRKPAKSIDSALRLLGNQTFSDHDLSELASAVGVLEWADGSSRQAKKHLRASLIAPNENTLAQARFMASDANASAFHLPAFIDRIVVPRPYEASTWRAFFNQDWSLAAEHAQAWAKDQIFSTRPIQLAAHIFASHLGNYDQAIIMAKMGQTANPRDHGFRITSAFSFGSSGRTREAAEELGEIKGQMSAEIEVAKTANYGLIGFREGDVNRGRSYYQDAVSIAHTKTNKALVTTALLYWAREEILAGDRDLARNLLERAKESLKAAPQIENPILLKRFEALLESSPPEIERSRSTPELIAQFSPEEPRVIRLNWKK